MDWPMRVGGDSCSSSNLCLVGRAQGIVAAPRSTDALWVRARGALVVTGLPHACCRPVGGLRWGGVRVSPLGPWSGPCRLWGSGGLRVCTRSSLLGPGDCLGSVSGGSRGVCWGRGLGPWGRQYAGHIPGAGVHKGPGPVHQPTHSHCEVTHAHIHRPHGQTLHQAPYFRPQPVGQAHGVCMPGLDTLDPELHNVCDGPHGHNGIDQPPDWLQVLNAPACHP